MGTRMQAHRHAVGMRPDDVRPPLFQVLVIFEETSELDLASDALPICSLSDPSAARQHLRLHAHRATRSFQAMPHGRIP